MESNITTVQSLAATPASDGDGSVTISAATIVEVLIELARYKRSILRCTGISMALGVITALLLPVKYSATTMILTPSPSPSAITLLSNQLNSTGAASLASAAGLGAGFGLRNPNDIYIGLLKSRPVADALIRKCDLLSIYRVAGPADARKKLASNTDIQSEKSGLIAITVTDSDKGRAAALANEYTAELRDLTNSIAISEASRRRVFFEKQIATVREALLNDEHTLQKFQQSHGIVQLDAQTKAMIARLSAIHTQMAEQEVALATLRDYSTEHNPEVQLASKQLSALQELAGKLENRNPAEGANPGLKDVAVVGLDYLRAEHELQYEQLIFDQLLKQYDAARLDEAKDGTVVQVVETAIPPERKSFPHRAQIVALFTMLGLVGVCLYRCAVWTVRRDPNLLFSLSELTSVLGVRRKSAESV